MAFETIRWGSDEWEYHEQIKQTPTTTQRVAGKFVKPTQWLAFTNSSYYGRWKNGNAGDSRIYPEPPPLRFGIGGPSVPNRSNLILKAAANVGNNKAQFAESLIEGKSTLKMFADRVTKLSQVVRAAKNKDWRWLRDEFTPANKYRRDGRSLGQWGLRRNRDANSLFLEYQFGWMPLAEDIKSIYEIFQDGIVNSKAAGSIVQGVATGEAVKSSGTYTWKMGLLGGGEGVYSGQQQSRCVLTYQLSKFTASDMLQVYGLGDPLQIAYNAAPLSFVADWFLPVGDMLGALHSTRNANFLDGYISTRTTSSTAATKAPQHYKPNKYFARTLPSAEYEGFAREVVLISGLPVLPRPQIPNSLHQAVTATALMTQRSRS